MTHPVIGGVSGPQRISERVSIQGREQWEVSIALLNSKVIGDGSRSQEAGVEFLSTPKSDNMSCLLGFAQYLVALILRFAILY